MSVLEKKKSALRTPAAKIQLVPLSVPATRDTKWKETRAKVRINIELIQAKLKNMRGKK